MPSPLLYVLGAVLRAAIWLIYGPFSELVPLFLLYCMIEFGIDFHASRSARERRLIMVMLIDCALGVVVWLMKDHTPLLLLLLPLLGLIICVTAVALILFHRGRGRRKKRRRDALRAAGIAQAPSPETDSAKT